MFKVSIQPQWQLEQADGKQSLPRLVELLARVRETGTLAEACIQAGLSYRYAWGLLQDGTRTFGAPLVTMQRGRGAVLTPLAEKLVWADKRINARLAPLLDSLASELEVELERALSDTGAILRVQASHGFAVETLRDWFVRSRIPIDLKYRSSFEALSSLKGGACDLAGFHVPVGDFEAQALTQYAAWLKPQTQRLIMLATRRQGLIVAPGNPKNIETLTDLTRDDVRFVNRQPGSGTRMLLDLMLERAGLDGSQIRGFDSGEIHPCRGRRLCRQRHGRCRRRRGSRRQALRSRFRAAGRRALFLPVLEVSPPDPGFAKRHRHPLQPGFPQSGQCLAGL